MKVKVIRSGDENFEEEKIKMFSPKTLTKEKQLRIAFKRLLTGLLIDYDIAEEINPENRLIEKYTNVLLKEVTIRVKL